MGKKGSWFSAIKRVFTHSSKEKLSESEKKSTKEKKKRGFGRLRNGEGNSFIPLFREPSSIEKILGDVEREHTIIFRPPTSPEQLRTPTFVPPRAASPRVASPRAASPRVASPRVASPRVASPRATSPRVASPRVVSQRHKEISYYRPEPTLRNHHASATRIQTAYRGYMARRSFRALRGLVRLQGVVRGQNVKRQTMNAMKHMQLLVRVQSQIQSRRIQMLENQAIQRQTQYKNDKELESTLGKWTLSQAGSEAGNPEDWDYSVLTKEQVDAKMQKKVEAIIKRERAMAYAYSHQLWKATPKSAQTALMDVRSGGFPWWWNWLERQMPPVNPPESQPSKNAHLTPPRSILGQKPSPRPQSSNSKQYPFEYDAMDALTPKSTRSAFAPRWKQPKTPISQAQTPNRLHAQAHSSSLTKHSKPRPSAANSLFDQLPMKDDDSLMSCPPFSVPNYMTPTASAKAKSRANSNPKERFQGTTTTPMSESKRRLSFPLSQGIGSFKWNKGSLFSSKDNNSSPRMLGGKNQSAQSISNMSVDSTVSLPAGVGRRPFNRFV